MSRQLNTQRDKKLTLFRLRTDFILLSTESPLTRQKNWVRTTRQERSTDRAISPL